MAKIVIDLNEHTINCVKCGQGIGWMSNAQLEEAIKNGVAIPDNATNGDVIKAIFPDAENIRMDNGLPLNFVLEFELHRNYKDWWNAKYKVGDTEPQKREEVYAESNN